MWYWSLLQYFCKQLTVHLCLLDCGRDHEDLRVCQQWWSFVHSKVPHSALSKSNCFLTFTASGCVLRPDNPSRFQFSISGWIARVPTSLGSSMFCIHSFIHSIIRSLFAKYTTFFNARCNNMVLKNSKWRGDPKETTRRILGQFFSN